MYYNKYHFDSIEILFCVIFHFINLLNCLIQNINYKLIAYIQTYSNQFHFLFIIPNIEQISLNFFVEHVVTVKFRIYLSVLLFYPILKEVPKLDTTGFSNNE
jgi:hypothetical protein